MQGFPDCCVSGHMHTTSRVCYDFFLFSVGCWAIENWGKIPPWVVHKLSLWSVALKSGNKGRTFVSI
jgi:hypothetical protein